jgi:hypothetical protein
MPKENKSEKFSRICAARRVKLFAPRWRIAHNRGVGWNDGNRRPLALTKRVVVVNPSWSK